MSDVETQNEPEVAGEARPRNLKINIILTIGVVVALIAGGLFLFTQVGSSQGCVGEGPCMLYFYADW